MAVDQQPIPDPTVLTTEQLERAIDNLKHLLQAEIKGMDSRIGEELKSVRTQFNLIERQRVEQKADTEKAVQAALSAAKEAVKEQTTAFALATDKSERAMTEQLKQLTSTFDTAIAGVGVSLNDLKERVGNIESIKKGGEEVRQQQGATVGQMFAGWGALAAFLALVATFAALVLR